MKLQFKYTTIRQSILSLQSIILQNPEYIKAKSILSPLKDGPDPYFGISYNMNIYRGCQHQCIYCDTRSSVYGVDNLAHIRIKSNALELLESKLRKLKTKGTIGTGSMNDPYMPIEKKEELYSGALQIIRKYRYPIHIITKSNLVLRDSEVIKSISETYAAVSFTITTMDDDLARKIEPGATLPSERIKAIRTLSQMGIYTGVVLTPVLPYLTNSKENIISIVNATAKAGGKYILAWMGLTQREGQREYFYKELDNSFPGISQKYHNMFGLNYNCPAPNSEELYNTFNDYCQTYSIQKKMEFYSPRLPQQLNLF